MQHRENKNKKGVLLFSKKKNGEESSTQQAIEASSLLLRLGFLYSVVVEGHCCYLKKTKLATCERPFAFTRKPESSIQKVMIRVCD